MALIAIIGRPNVGKSTIFNRILGQQKAVVEDIPGVTRDRIYGHATWGDKSFFVVDTGGFEFEELMDEIVKTLPEENPEIEQYPKIAIVGRPNVGKSTLVNSLIGKERMLVSNIPGTTRDAIDSV